MINGVDAMGALAPFCVVKAPLGMGFLLWVGLARTRDGRLGKRLHTASRPGRLVNG